MIIMLNVIWLFLKYVRIYLSDLLILICLCHLYQFLLLFNFLLNLLNLINLIFYSFFYLNKYLLLCDELFLNELYHNYCMCSWTVLIHKSRSQRPMLSTFLHSSFYLRIISNLISGYAFHIHTHLFALSDL